MKTHIPSTVVNAIIIVISAILFFMVLPLNLNELISVEGGGSAGEAIGAAFGAVAIVIVYALLMVLLALSALLNFIMAFVALKNFKAPIKAVKIFNYLFFALNILLVGGSIFKIINGLI